MQARQIAHKPFPHEDIGAAEPLNGRTYPVALVIRGPASPGGADGLNTSIRADNAGQGGCSPAPAPAATARVCPFFDPVECSACGAIGERKRMEDSAWKVVSETFDHPAEYIPACPHCKADEPNYDTPEACDDCDGSRCCEELR